VPPLPDPNGVFLNIPYDEEFLRLYIAYIVIACIVGLYQLDLVPHLAPEIPGGDRRLNKFIELTQSCSYSIHDLSRVELSRAPTAVPRFNMPPELGMTISWQNLNPSLHTWFVWEQSDPYPIQRSASDRNGTHAYIHNGTPEGVLRELCNCFESDHSTSVPKRLDVFRFVNNQIDALVLRKGTHNSYDRRVLRELCWLSSSLSVFLRHTKPAV
jgi:hypothetical protein